MKSMITACIALLMTSALDAQTNLTKREIKAMKKTHEISMLAVRIADLAPDHALSAETKATAKRLAEDYIQIRGRLEALAAKKNLPLAAGASERASDMVAWYAKKQGKDFDKAYLKGASKVNKRGICHIRKVYRRTEDPDVKDWSGKLLSTLEIHRTLLKQSCEALKKMN